MTSRSAATGTDQVSDLYDSFGPLLSMIWDDNYHFGYWEDAADDSSIEVATDRFTDVLIGRLGVGGNDRVLDVGCGVGKPAVRLAEATGAAVVGISTNALQISKAGERAEARGLVERVTFQKADAMETGFDDASFDAVLAFESLVHMDRAKALREIRRVLVPGGRLVLTDLTVPKGLERSAGGAGKLSSLTSLDEYPQVIADAGFVLDELVDVTDHTRYTVPRITENLQRHRDEFERVHGVNVDDIHNATISSDMDVADIGCLIAVAHRPGPF
ncbi:SAM-dependent methyltransferase [Actinomadura macrotermitis]|uniref:Demethylrebeccamycin-D-glucose O-methyltransferase n=1 Tax=Actinomadura macrotermitis TaxID=2585200 RepID=A0A7K0BV74_9ACTN|nr:methyltransferase domain-containing protein [Actinomadura macrotermitis]MQY05073.1 Demethylrebeccamycin-D-glucose O-methyltransferase [Actinomadura macrotermitis]